MTKCKFIVKNSNFIVLVVFSPIFATDTKITFVYNFVAPLTAAYVSIDRKGWLQLSANTIIMFKVKKHKQNNLSAIFVTSLMFAVANVKTSVRVFVKFECLR